VFSGQKEKYQKPEFSGGEINCVFGALELDLSDAQLAEGTHVLELNATFGGVILYIPVDWKVQVQQTHVFGRFLDSREKPNVEVDENRLLIIKGASVFGGGEIRLRK
jgi:predicted membrane protein